MKRLERDAVVTALIDALGDNGSWCGETHIQKAMFFLQEMAGTNLEFDFILYKHGPFSFGLRDELTAMRADLLLELDVRKPGYGPSLRPTDNARAMVRRYQGTVDGAQPGIEFVAKHVGDRDVAELERLGTALYVARRKKPDGSIEVQAQEIHQLKPHVTLEDARKAIKTVRSWQEELPS